ncbi:casein kinase 1-like protein 7 isoform X2 [Eurytemora carolleeae]|uniref:casein kinase 1-like protein 7 isoform X2 n=1 Tax=Eurytemora carolleeae TaxID=1294199 RepID=UPI000C76DF34|nr:casein kinase 1-like protein 7 isoform X2 [Eurytemora carolleeae]|eukprot:XP_023328411.1 casein kinase 1-like protein 7 isoform X2 [Eurytemora affinis]
MKEKYKRIKNTKMKYTPELLCQGCPTQYQEFLRYSKGLTFSQKPDYVYCQDLFHRCYEKNGYTYKDFSFDWSKLTLPSNLYKVNQTNKLDQINEGTISSPDTSSEESLDTTNHHSVHTGYNSAVKTEDVGRSHYEGKSVSSNTQENRNTEKSSEASTKTSKMRNSKSLILSPRKLQAAMKKSDSNYEMPSSSTYSQGYYSNSSASGTTQGATSSGPTQAPVHPSGAVRRVERSPADRLLRDIRDVNFDAIERLASQNSQGNLNRTSSIYLG